MKGMTITRATVTTLLAAALGIGACAQEGGGSPPADLALPADAEGAEQALLDSPRHGEWVDIAMPGGETKIKTWVVYPERSDPAPVVIVIHEIFGLTDWVRGVADALAAAGFVAVAPDLLSGMGPGGGGTDSFEGDAVRSAIRQITTEEQAKRLNAVRAYAVGLSSTTDKTATIGFCWGGSASFAYATAQPALNAAVVCYGTAPREHSELDSIKCPVLGLYGGDDNRVTSTVEPTKEAMKERGKSYTTHIYEGAGHGFLRQQDGRDGENLAAAKAAWKETIAFLRERLK